MIWDNAIIKEDCERICADGNIPWEMLRGKSVVVTGATGLIGKNLMGALLYANRQRGLGMRITSPVRSREKAEAAVGTDPCLEFVEGDGLSLPDDCCGADYIIHGASVTDSKWFVNRPVDVLKVASAGTINMLDMALRKNTKGFLYLSSMEVYGTPASGKIVREEDIAGFRPEVIRSSYPISKTFCESLCCSYAAQFAVPAKVIRLTQTFGPGVEYMDGRVFAQFMRCALEKKNIVLKTKGETERCYLYTADAVTAILAVLLKGETGACYTAAHPDTYYSIADMAGMAAEWLADGQIGVEYDIDPLNTSGYANTMHMKLDVSKLRSLGWEPKYTLRDMFVRMAAGYH